MSAAAAFRLLMRAPKITMSTRLPEGMTRHKHPRTGEDPFFNHLFQRKLGTAAIADASEAAMQHLRGGVWLSQQVDIIRISERPREITESWHGTEVNVCVE